MKKTRRICALVTAAFLLLLCACQQQTAETPSPSPDEIQNKSAFYQTIMESDSRPVAVMIDNDNKDAWPHAGLDEAYLLYEIFVEGGATRLMAVFKDAAPEKIGPIRSSRHYFLDYVLENDALYAHSGWSPKAQNDIPALGINNINGILGSDAAPFWREAKFAGDYHSLFSSMENLSALFDKKGYRRTSDVRNLKFAPQEEALTGGTPASTISIPYTAGFYRVDYTYNPETKTYDRSMNQSPHALQNGKTVSPKNVVVQFAKNYLLAGDDKRQDVETTAGGTGYYCSNGQCIEITWSKAARDQATIYRDLNGDEIVFNPGQTIIQIAPPQTAIAIN